MTTLIETKTEATTPHVHPPSTSGFFYGPADFLRITDMTYFKAADFKRHALKRARFEVLEDGSIYGEIPNCPGVWANARTQRACRNELKEVLADWVDVKLRDEDKDFPVIEGINLNVL